MLDLDLDQSSSVLTEIDAPINLRSRSAEVCIPIEDEYRSGSSIPGVSTKNESENIVSIVLLAVELLQTWPWQISAPRKQGVFFVHLMRVIIQFSSNPK